MIKNTSVISASNWIKIISVCCFILVDISLIYAHDSPATGYEPSIYGSTPAILWISLIIALACGVAIVIYAVYHNAKSNVIWLTGLLLILMAYVTGISVYLIRSYYLWAAGGDASTHMLFVKEILDSGNISPSLIYPITHILTVELFEFTGIDLLSLEKLIPIFFSLLFILFVYTLARSIFSEKGQVFLITVASCMFIMGYPNFIPNYLADCFLPIFLFILVKLLGVKKLNWIALAFIMVLMYPVFHIIPSFVVILMILTFLISARVYNLFNVQKKIGQFIYGLLAFLLILWSTLWITSFDIWHFTIQKAYTLLAWGGDSYASSLSGQMTQAQSYGYDVIGYILKTEGNIAIFILIAVLICPIIWIEMRDKKTGAMILFYASILTICAYTVVLYFLNIGFGPLRLLSYITLICALFVGYAFYTLIKKLRSVKQKPIRYLMIGLTILLIVILFVSKLSVIYPSPYTLQLSLQTTKKEVSGMGWIINDRNLNYDMLNTNLAYYRFAHILLTPEGLKGQNIPETVMNTLSTPYHFGYNQTNMFASTYKNDAYLMVTQRDKSVYKDIFPQLAKYRFTPYDFDQLSADPSINKIYANGEFDTYSLYHP
jgi:hypothetical protein